MEVNISSGQPPDPATFDSLSAATPDLHVGEEDLCIDSIEEGETMDATEFERCFDGAKRLLDKVFINPQSRDTFLDPSPNLMICGMPRAGKSSLIKMIFQGASPHETMHLNKTSHVVVQKISNTVMMNLTVIDFSGSVMTTDPRAMALTNEFILPRVDSLVFVIDANNEPFGKEVALCKDLFKEAWQRNPNVNLEVFIHKVDGDIFDRGELRAECQRHIHDKLLSHLHEEAVEATVNFYTTSIYEHTITEAVSKVVQKLIPAVAPLEQLLDYLVASSRMEKAYLIDVGSKTFIATDSSPFDVANFELCTDMIEVALEVSYIYGPTNNIEDGNAEREAEVPPPRKAEEGGSTSVEETKDGLPTSSEDNDQSPHSTTMCLIQLNTEVILYLKEIDRMVAIACVIREENFDRQCLVDLNIRTFRNTVIKLLEVESKAGAERQLLKIQHLDRLAAQSYSQMTFEQQQHKER